MNHLTSREYWNAAYSAIPVSAPLADADYRRLPEHRIASALERVGVSGRRVLEIGAGDSVLLCHLAHRFAGSAAFTGLDYSELGCHLLEQRAASEGARLQVVLGDLFAPSPDLVASFDLVYSLGVVEHFPDLRSVLDAKRRLTAPGGRVFTLVPNMRGLPGALARRFNRSVYDIHVAHDLASLAAGHRAAGLEVERAFHLCSTNFGLLSACFRGPMDRGYRAYRWLSRLSKALWYIEWRVGDLPATAALSPYLVVVSRRPEGT